MNNKIVTYLIVIFLILQTALLAMQITNSVRQHNQVNKFKSTNSQFAELYKQEKELFKGIRSRFEVLEEEINILCNEAGVE